MKTGQSNWKSVRLSPLLTLAALLGTVASLAAAPLILDVVETGGDNEATDTVAAKWTGQTFINGIANEPLPNTAADAPFTVSFFQEAAPAFVDRNHRYTQASTTLPLPSYLLGAEYIMSGNDNRDNNSYQLDITVSKACIVYMLVDNRMPDNKVNTTAPIFGTTRDSNMGWLPLDGFTGVFSGINRDGSLERPDEIGIDEGADGAGPGLGVNQWYSIYAKQFPAGTLSIYQANNPGRNMYGVVVAPVPDNPRITASSGDLFGITFQVTDGNVTALDPNSIALTLDGQPVTPTVSKDGAVTTIKYAPPVIFPSLSPHTATLTVSDNASPANEIASTLQFTAEYYGTLTAAMAVPANALNLNEQGFVARVAQAQLLAKWPAPALPTSIRRAEDHLAGRLRNPETGSPFPNVAYTGDAETDGTYRIPGIAFPDEYINWNQESGPGGNGTEAGNFTSTTTGDPDGPIPGIPGDDATNLDNFSAEITTYLNLNPGVYRLGVNSDDGFKVTAGKGDPRDPTGLLLGQVDAGRGAANTLFYVNVEAAGYYPIRLLYFEGGGGASLEFFSVDTTTGVFRLINDTADPLAIKAYALPTVKRPYASISPLPNSINVAANAPVQAQLFDQTAIVTPASIRLELNGAPVTPNVSKSGPVTTVLYQAPNYLPPGTNVATLVYADNGSPALSVTNTWQFVVENYAAYPVIPAAYAVPAGSVDLNSSGFLVDSYSMAVARSGFADNNSYPAAEQQLARGYIDPATTQPYANLFTTGTVNGKHLVTLVNWNQDAPANAGNFTAANINADSLIPGQPAAGDSNNIVAEAIGYVDLKKGYYQLGVNSDDGFRVTTAPNFKDAAALQLGLFNTGRGAADTLFPFFVEADGIYPIRLLWWEGTGGASCEFFIVEPATGARRLINDRVNTAYFAVNSYATYTGPERPYLKSITPANGAVGQFPDVTLQAVIANLAGGSVKLTINGLEVTPTITAQGPDTLVTYAPAELYASGSTNVAVLEYAGIPTTVTFVVQTYVTLPAEVGLPSSSADTEAPGFWSRIVKAPNSVATLANTTDRAEQQLAGTLIDPITSQPYVNEIAAGPGPNGTYLTDLVNWNVRTNSNEGNFGSDSLVPGVDATATNNFNLAAEVVAWLDLPQGLVKMGVNSDDGFRVTIATNAAPAALQVGLFEGGRGPADTWFSFITPNAGLYPVRLLYYQGGGGGSVELFSFNNTGARTLVNDPANPAAVKAYYQVVGGVTPPPQIGLPSVADGIITVTWTGGGTLEYTDSLDSDWTSTNDNDGEYTEAASQPHRFYRVKR